LSAIRAEIQGGFQIFLFYDLSDLAGLRANKENPMKTTSQFSRQIVNIFTISSLFLLPLLNGCGGGASSSTDKLMKDAQRKQALTRYLRTVVLNKVNGRYTNEKEILRQAKDLVSQGADVNWSGGHSDPFADSYPLDSAIYLGDMELVEFLVSSGAQVYRGLPRIGDSDSPLHKAVECHNVEIAKFLISKGAGVNDKEEPIGPTPLDIADRISIRNLDDKARQDNEKMREYLISVGGKKLYDLQRGK